MHDTYAVKSRDYNSDFARVVQDGTSGTLVSFFVEYCKVIRNIVDKQLKVSSRPTS